MNTEHSGAEVQQIDSDQPVRTVQKDGFIEVGVDDPAQLFDRFDRSGGERHLVEQVDQLIVLLAQERPADGYILSVRVRNAPQFPEGFPALASAICDHFGHRAREADVNLRFLVSKGKRDLFVGFLFLSICGTLGVLAGRLLPADVGPMVEEGFVIIGWVALWRPVDLFLYDLRPLRRERDLLTRLRTMEVRFETH